VICLKLKVKKAYKVMTAVLKGIEMTIKAVISQEKRTRDIFKIDKKNECKC
jgi:hypothetical protein